MKRSCDFQCLGQIERIRAANDHNYVETGKGFISSKKKVLQQKPIWGTVHKEDNQTQKQDWWMRITTISITQRKYFHY